MRHIYAVGDIHGCDQALEDALEFIEADAGNAAADVIFLGDYVDRGPDSKRVVDMLMAGPRRKGDIWRCLKGNHEDIMVEALRRSGDRGMWFLNGGGATMRSFDNDVPDAVLTWLEKLPCMVETENHIFVHAGLHPEKALGAQVPEEMMWIRDRFLNSDFDFGKHVVHGHTPRKNIEHRPFRTNLDTGACFGGMLSVGIFDLDRKCGPIRVAQFPELCLSR